MNEMITKRNDLLAQKIIKGLESRNMKGFYAHSKAEALKIALELIPAGSSVTMGGSVSAREIGLVDTLKVGEYSFIDRDLADGNANRVSAIAFGPRKVIFIVGMNKVCKDVDSAMKRARNIAAPVNAQRFGLDTPCCSTGSCMDCKSPDTICCQFLITRYSRHDDRIYVILVNDNLGF